MAKGKNRSKAKEILKDHFEVAMTSELRAEQLQLATVYLLLDISERLEKDEK